jgi:YVTN family beta-propeller protein
VSSAVMSRPPRARWRHRLSALTCSAALAVTGLVALASPAFADSAPTTLATIAVGSGPVGVAVAPDGTHAYVVNENDGTLGVIDTATDTVSATVAVGSVPLEVAVSPDGAHAYVTDAGSNTLSVVDTATDAVSASIPVGANPAAVAVSPDGTHVFVANAIGNTVSVINTATGTVTATVPVGSGPSGLAVSPDGAHVYVANAGGFLPGNTVSVINTATETVSATITVGGSPSDVVFSPDGTRAYVSNGDDNTVSVIDTATGSVAATIPVGSDPNAVAVSPDGAHVYTVNTEDGTVSVIDTATDTVGATATVGNTPFSIAASPDGTRLYVVNNADSTVSVLSLVAPPVPTVTAISPSTGSMDGGTTVTITGTGLTGATEANFGPGNPGTNLSCASDTSCTVTSPPGTTGTVDVQVTTPGGTSATSSADQYTYAPDLTTTITGPSGPVAVGTSFTYTETVTNVYGPTLTNYTAYTQLTGADSAITAVSDSAGDICTASGPYANCTLGGSDGLANGETITLTVTVTPNQPGTIGAGVYAGYYPTVLSSATTTTTITGPDLTATIAGPTVPVPANAPYTYTETITNQTGAAGNATNLTADPTLNPGAGDTAAATIIAVTSSQGSCTVTGTTSAACALGTLAPGASATITVTVLPTAPGTVSIGDNPSAVGVGVFANPTATTTVTAAVPVVTRVSPSSGPLSAGTVVAISGTGLSGATRVTFGADGPATNVSCTATSCTATAPAGTAGTVDVLVTTPGGTSAAVSGDKYTYVAAPTITKISPTSGPSVGGTKVTITGTNLSGATITFGTGHNATTVTCTATSCTATAPAGNPGTVDVQATTPGGTSATNSNDKYTYTASSDLAITLAGNPNPVALGGYGTITATVTDLGPQAATVTGASVTFSGANAAILKVTPSQGTCTVDTTHRTVNCALGTISTTKAATIAITVEPDTTGTLTAAGAVLGLPWDPNPTNNTAILNTTIANTHGCTRIGTPGNDLIVAVGPSVICDLGGNDLITTAFDGTIYLGSGNDTVTSTLGTETIYGGLGTDTITTLTGPNDVIYAGDYLNPTANPDYINGGLGHTTCYITQADHVTGCAVTITH